MAEIRAEGVSRGAGRRGEEGRGHAQPGTVRANKGPERRRKGSLSLSSSINADSTAAGGSGGGARDKTDGGEVPHSGPTLRISQRNAVNDSAPGRIGSAEWRFFFFNATQGYRLRS